MLRIRIRWAVLLVLAMVLMPHGSLADSGCITVKGTSSGETFTPDFLGGAPFQGTANLRTSAGHLTADVTVFLTAPPIVRGKNTFASTRHVFDVKDESGTEVVFFFTDDAAVLPETGKPGLLRVNSRAAVTGGEWATDPVMAASGHLVVNGTLQLIPPGDPGDPIAAVATWKVKGRLCASDE